MKKNLKKILLFVIVSLVIIIIIVGIKLNSDFNSLETAFEPIVIKKEITFDSLDKKFYLIARSWGITGNHNEIVLSTKPFEQISDWSNFKNKYIFYCTELYYKKQGKDTLDIFVTSSAVGKIPNDFSNNIIVLIHELKSYDEIQTYDNNYKLFGLEKISVY